MCVFVRVCMWHGHGHVCVCKCTVGVCVEVTMQVRSACSRAK